MSQVDDVRLASQEQASFNGFVLFVSCVAALGGILFGFDTGVISGAILFITNQFQLSDWMNGFVVSSVLFGAIVGALLSGRAADYFGRRKLLIITSLIFIVCTLGSALAPTIPILVAARLIVGIAIGIASFTAPLYISEIAPPRWRGMLVSLNQLAITIGIVLSYLVDMKFAPHSNWRWMFGMGVVPAALLFIGMMFLPRSPRWLVLQGLIDQARTALQKMRDTNVESELSEIKESLQNSKKSSWRVLFSGWVRPALMIAVLLAIFQQVTGINTIIYYAPTVFQMAGFKSAEVAIYATFGIGIGIGIVNVLFTFVALALMDRWGVDHC